MRVSADKGSHTKVLFLVARPLREGIFLKLSKIFPPKNVATKLEGGGGKALVAGSLKNDFFAAA